MDVYWDSQDKCKQLLTCGRNADHEPLPEGRLIRHEARFRGMGHRNDGKVRAFDVTRSTYGSKRSHFADQSTH